MGGTLLRKEHSWRRHRCFLEQGFPPELWKFSLPVGAAWHKQTGSSVPPASCAVGNPQPTAPTHCQARGDSHPLQTSFPVVLPAREQLALAPTAVVLFSRCRD